MMARNENSLFWANKSQHAVQFQACQGQYQWCFTIPPNKILLMEEILHQLRLVVYPSIYRVLYIRGGAGILLSTVFCHKLKKSMKINETHHLSFFWNAKFHQPLGSSLDSNLAEVKFITWLGFLVFRILFSIIHLNGTLKKKQAKHTHNFSPWPHEFVQKEAFCGR